MFSFLGRMAYRWRWATLIVWGAALLLSLPVLPRVAGSLKVGGFSSPNTEAAHAREVLQRELGFAPSTLLVVYQSDELRADDPEFRAAVMGYAEWGTRLAMHNSSDADDIAEHAPVPRWGWGVAPPYEP